MPVGLFPFLLNGMVSTVCGVCHGNQTTKVSYSSNGKPNGTALKRNLMEFMADMISPTHISFPIPVGEGNFIANKGKQFLPVVSDVSGIAFLTKKKTADVYGKVIGSSVFNCWPLLVLVIVSSVLSGLIIWALVRTYVLLMILMAFFNLI